MTSARLLSQHRVTLRAFGAGVVPELANADEVVWRDVETTIAKALSTRSPRMLRQLELLLRMIELLSRLRFGRSLDRLERTRRERFLLKLQRSPLKLLRRGVWGLRTLVLMGHYTRSRVATELGYRADARGWAARRATP